MTFHCLHDEGHAGEHIAKMPEPHELDQVIKENSSETLERWVWVR